VLGGGAKKNFDGFGDEFTTRPYIRCRFGGAKDTVWSRDNLCKQFIKYVIVVGGMESSRRSPGRSPGRAQAFLRLFGDGRVHAS